MSDEAEVVSEEKQDGPRVFMSAAYLLPLDQNTYGLYRDMLVLDEETGQKEKAGKIGPIRLLRKAAEGEQVFLRTVHPKTGKELALTEV